MEALLGSMPHSPVRLFHHRQAMTPVTRLPSALLLAPVAVTRLLAPQSIARRGLAAVMAIFRQPLLQLRHAGLQLSE
jgi:hypothetical protein